MFINSKVAFLKNKVFMRQEKKIVLVLFFNYANIWKTQFGFIRFISSHQNRTSLIMFYLIMYSFFKLI